MPAAGLTLSRLITFEIIVERQRRAAFGRTSGTDGCIGHGDRRTITVIADTLRIDIVVSRSLQAGDEDLIRVIHDGIEQIVILRLLCIGQFAVRQEQTVFVLITLPADDRTILAHAIYRERRDRTAERNQINRYFRDICVVGCTEIAEEHDMATHVAHVVAHVVLKAYAERIPGILTEVERIQRHERAEVGRVGNDTDDDLAIIGRRVITASPEIDLVFSDIIYIQFRHDRITTYVVGRRGYIVIQLEIVLAVMHRRRVCLHIRDIGGWRILCLRAYQPARHLTARAYGKAIVLSEGDRTHLLRRKCLTGRSEGHRRPLRRDRIATKRFSRNVVLGLALQAANADAGSVGRVATNDPCLRYHIRLFGQILLTYIMVGEQQLPIIACTQTTADTYAGSRQFRNTRLRQRTSHRDNRYVIQIDIVARFLTSAPC